LKRTIRIRLEIINEFAILNRLREFLGTGCFSSKSLTSLGDTVGTDEKGDSGGLEEEGGE
jgi:hypothetical protein